MVTATRHETEAERLDEDETIEPEEVDDNLDGKQLEKAGRFVALWNHTDAQFFVVRMDQFTETVYDGIFKTAHAGATWPGGDTKVEVDYKSLMWKEKEARWDFDDTTEPIYGHELSRCVSVVAASDREASFRHGMGIDRLGNEIKVQRMWYPVAVQVTEPAFKRQLHEILQMVGFGERPELPTHFHGLTDLPYSRYGVWTTDLKILVDQCDRMYEFYKDEPPSATQKVKNEPTVKGRPDMALQDLGTGEGQGRYASHPFVK